LGRLRGELPFGAPSSSGESSHARTPERGELSAFAETFSPTFSFPGFRSIAQVLAVSAGESQTRKQSSTIGNMDVNSNVLKSGRQMAASPATVRKLQTRLQDVVKDLLESPSAGALYLIRVGWQNSVRGAYRNSGTGA